jgi:DNA-binding MarR family transcriptional regulator
VPPAVAATDLDTLMITLMDRMRAIFMTRLQLHELSPPQGITLRLLQEPQPMHSIAGHLACDPSNLTGIADRLEERGLVERRPDPADRRVKLLALTPAGRRLRAKLEADLSDQLPGLDSLTPAERAHLERLLAKLLG